MTMDKPRKWLTTIADEIGLLHLIHSPLDVKILCFQRTVRFLAYGSTTLILVLFLRALDISEERIGLFMTLTLFGDVFVSLILTVIADGLGRRRTLAMGALLMAGSGVVFALSSNYWILLLAAVLGVISPSGNEIGPFRAVEESTISALTGREERTGILAWYTVFGYSGASLGVLVGGWVLRLVQKTQDWDALDSYRLVFWAYAVLGLTKFALCLLLSNACEPERKETVSGDARRPLLAGQEENVAVPIPNDRPHLEDSDEEPKESLFSKLTPNISQQSASLLWKLCLLFAMDSIASGLTPASWVTYFFSQKFGLREDQLGTLFFVANVLSVFSNFAAAPLARRIGLIKTMVFTHVPASIALALIPVPNSLVLAIGLLAVRYCLNSMDQAPRQAFLAAAVQPEERTAVMGTVNVVKTLSQSVGPLVTGALAGRSLFWVSFIMAGSLKLLYDVLMLGLFLGYRTVEERAEETLEASANEEEGAPAPSR
ncbi:uncharacterized protein AB675_6052 [Cyphellophora attinorum]|uniref:Putative membrane protein n=1 Tax=Cyphellophora attinorum TaxID=1664694 RepID=A0A0N0NJJ6_9EURO|nr:uncharacterized protein AB675_6052 [Phialophora attinorum]KPI36978.1 putative membrane protein [Phialophora attinorum]